MLHTFCILQLVSACMQTTTQLVDALQQQLQNISSPLRNGVVTATAAPDYFTVTTELADVGPAEAALTAAGYSVTVLPYQMQGLFSFSAAGYFVTAASGVATLTVIRQQVRSALYRYTSL